MGLIFLRAMYSLGFINVFRVLVYRLMLKALRCYSCKEYINIGQKIETQIYPEINKNERDYGTNDYSALIDWGYNVYTGEHVGSILAPWYCISDFECKVGDVKGIWFNSRFDWLFTAEYNVVNKLLTSWILDNPPYFGINWKCGQEASIRVLHLAVYTRHIGLEENTTKELLDFIESHLARISFTSFYAVAQDNNHGTTEAAALYVGGSWLFKFGRKIGGKWCNKGMRLLEDRVGKLIDVDGSFSQYSTNYHRMMLDSLSIVEIWRRHLLLPEFSSLFYKRLGLAVNWLYQLVQLPTGYVPNTGANDGALLIPIEYVDPLDFRPCVQLSSILFLGKLAWPLRIYHDQRIEWLQIDLPNSLLPCQNNFHFFCGGYLGLRDFENLSFVLMKYPKFKFRPSQSDALHVDFWINGVNFLRDGGTYSYNAGDEVLNYYSSCKGHNTIEFDGRDQMPRISRFLFGSWLDAKDIRWIPNESSFQAKYEDYQGVSHQRTVILSPRKLTVIDNVFGFKNKAVLRWRLNSGEWKVDKENNVVSDGDHALRIYSTNVHIARIDLVVGYESKSYYEKSEVPVIEIEINTSGQLTTEYTY